MPWDQMLRVPSAVPKVLLLEAFLAVMDCSPSVALLREINTGAMQKGVAAGLNQTTGHRLL